MAIDIEFRNKMEALEEIALRPGLQSEIPLYVRELIASNIRKYLQSNLCVSEIMENMKGAYRAIYDTSVPRDDDPILVALSDITG